MKPFVIPSYWEQAMLDQLSDLKVDRVWIDILPHACFSVQYIAAVKDDKGKEWNAIMVLDEFDPLNEDFAGLVSKLREIITDPKYRS